MYSRAMILIHVGTKSKNASFLLSHKMHTCIICIHIKTLPYYLHL